ncbi:MAG TPA: 50S ribosomal protein L5 [Planctomycetota bacterium]|jgi:large subunit ribosomal protein L5|nr:50S ribosomal protein L5 [Planctomycetota bacterium]
MARLQEKYRSEIVPQMVDRFGFKNVNAVPRLWKITVSMGIGKAVENNKRIEAAVKDLSLITGQKPIVTKAKQSIAGFKLREGMNVGAKVTLRGARMYEFFDRLISVVIPRIRDFRGFSARAFDGQGNYSLGLTEQLVFPEIAVENVEFVQGLNVCLTIDRSSDEHSMALLEFFGFPFRR